MDDFVNHFIANEINNNSITYQDALDDVCKYLGAKSNDIELIELKDSQSSAKFFNSNPTKDIVITLKESSDTSWSQNLGKSRIFDTSVTDGNKKLTIKNVSTDIRFLNIQDSIDGASNFENIVLNTRHLESLESKLKSEKTKIIKQIAKDNNINELFIDFEKSNIQMNESRNSLNSLIRNKQIKLNVVLKEGFSFDDNSNSYSKEINYEYLSFDENILSNEKIQNLAESIAKFIHSNDNITASINDVFKSNVPTLLQEEWTDNLTLEIINPNEKPTRIHHSSTYIWLQIWTR